MEALEFAHDTRDEFIYAAFDHSESLASSQSSVPRLKMHSSEVSDVSLSSAASIATLFVSHAFNFANLQKISFGGCRNLTDKGKS